MKKHGLHPVLGKPYFPLTEEMIDRIHMFAHGNPRQIIRIFGKLFDAFIYEGNVEKKISDNQCGKIGVRKIHGSWFFNPITRC